MTPEATLKEVKSREARMARYWIYHGHSVDRYYYQGAADRLDSQANELAAGNCSCHLLVLPYPLFSSETLANPGAGVIELQIP